MSSFLVITIKRGIARGFIPGGGGKMGILKEGKWKASASEEGEENP